MGRLQSRTEILLEVRYTPGEVLQSVRCLPCKPGDQSSIPRTHKIVLFGLKLVVRRWHSQRQAGGNRGILGAHGTASPA